MREPKVMRIIPIIPPGAPSAANVSVVQPNIDWQSFSKTIVLELGFLAGLVAVVTGHGTPDIVSLVWGAGGTLGILGVTDRVTNAVNVRSYLNAPNAATTGVVPQAAGTPLVQAQTLANPTNGVPNASPPAA